MLSHINQIFLLLLLLSSALKLLVVAQAEQKVPGKKILHQQLKRQIIEKSTTAATTKVAENLGPFFWSKLYFLSVVVTNTITEDHPYKFYLMQHQESKYISSSVNYCDNNIRKSFGRSTNGSAHHPHQHQLHQFNQDCNRSSTRETKVIQLNNHRIEHPTSLLLDCHLRSYSSNQYRFKVSKFFSYRFNRPTSFNTSLIIFLFFFALMVKFDLYSSTSIKIKTETNNVQKKIDNTSYNAIINGEISLPCNITAPSFDDGVSLVLWYRDDIATPIYTVDARQSNSLERAQHFLHTDIFEKRATFNLSYPLSFLMIKHVKPSDGGDYRCRVDFRRARTVNRILKLTVIVPTTNVVVYDQNFTIIDQIAGPFEEDSNQSLICDSSEGNPLPVVHWWKGSRLIDTEYFIVNNTISRNVLQLNNLSRDDLQLSLTCQAYNTNLTVPIVKTITLDLLLKPKEIRIITPLLQQQQKNNGNISTTLTTITSPSSGNNGGVSVSSSSTSLQPIEFACQCSGSKPPAKIRWRKGPPDEWLDAFSTIVSNDGLTTTSFLSYVPSIEDNGKNLSCIGYNPEMSPAYSIENFWPININYAPILSLVMGSDSLSQDILEGSNVYLECDIKANPYVTAFGWKLNGQMLIQQQGNDHHLQEEKQQKQENGAGVPITRLFRLSTGSSMVGPVVPAVVAGVEMRNTSLLITNVNHEHYGHYQCYAANKLGSSQSESVFLNVKYSPRCRNSKTILVGIALEETVSIECQVLANPSNVLFEWRLENVNKTKSIKLSNSSFQNQGLKSIAKYRAMTIDDYGYLYCHASNIVGRQDKPCVFHIIKAEAPSHPHNCSLVNKTAHSLTVECLPGHSGGLEQTFFLQVYSLDPNRLLKNLSNHEVPFFSIDDLPSGFIFKLVIYAANRKGISKSIEITGSTTEPSPWKSAEFESNDHISSMTPLLLVITMITIILISLVSVFVHIRKRIKGRMRTVVQASDTAKKPHRTTAATITPKSIMKKQKNTNFFNTIQTISNSSTAMNNINVIGVTSSPNSDLITSNETIEINDFPTTSFKPDYLQTVDAYALDPQTCILANCLSQNIMVDGSTTTTTGSTTNTTGISQSPYFVPSHEQQHQQFLVNEESSSSLSLHTQLPQHSYAPHHQHHHQIHSHHHHHFAYNTIDPTNNTAGITNSAILETTLTGNGTGTLMNNNEMEISCSLTNSNISPPSSTFDLNNTFCPTANASVTLIPGDEGST